MQIHELQAEQAALEDIFALDVVSEDLKNDKLAKSIHKYLKRRRRLISKFTKNLSITDTEYKRD